MNTHVDIWRLCWKKCHSVCILKFGPWLPWVTTVTTHVGSSNSAVHDWPLLSKWKLWWWRHLIRCVWTGCTKCEKLGSFANHCKRSVLGRHGNLCSEDCLLQEIILVVGHCNVINQSGIKTLPFKDNSAYWIRYMIIFFVNGIWCWEKTKLQGTRFWHGQLRVESVRVKIACDAKYDGKEDEVDTEIAVWSQLDSPIRMKNIRHENHHIRTWTSSLLV